MGLKYSKKVSIENRSCLEDLSNELIYELFDYLSHYNICLSFGNLNQRFQDLIDTYSHYVNLQDCHKHKSNQLLPKYIHTLKISARYQLSYINLSKISPLRGLIISNLTINHLQEILNTISLNELEYVYIGACANYYEWEQKNLGYIQEKILSLGEFKLKKCVLRIKFCANMDQLPTQLSSLEYLRIDGCQNLKTVNKLLDRTPNLRSLYVTIFERIPIDDRNNSSIIQQNNKCHYLTNLIIRIYDSISLTELIPFFIRYGSNIKNLIIYLQPIREHSSDYDINNLYQTITTMINEQLPQLINFRLRQCILSNIYNDFNRRCYFSPYIEQIPDSLEHRAYRVFIPRHLIDSWRRRG